MPLPLSHHNLLALQQALLTGFPDHCICRTARKLARKKVFFPLDWEDLRQEMYLRILQRLPQFDPERGCFHAFVKLIVRQFAANAYRYCLASARNKRQEVSLAAMVAGEEGPIELAELIGTEERNRRLQRHELPEQEAAELKMDIANFLASLSVRHRKIARRLQRLSPAEVADELRLHRSTVYAAIRNLRVLMEGKGMGDYRPSILQTDLGRGTPPGSEHRGEAPAPSCAEQRSSSQDTGCDRSFFFSTIGVTNDGIQRLHVGRT